MGPALLFPFVAFHVLAALLSGMYLLSFRFGEGLPRTPRLLFLDGLLFVAYLLLSVYTAFLLLTSLELDGAWALYAPIAVFAATLHGIRALGWKNGERAYEARWRRGR